MQQVYELRHTTTHTNGISAWWQICISAAGCILLFGSFLTSAIFLTFLLGLLLIIIGFILMFGTAQSVHPMEYLDRNELAIKKEFEEKSTG